MWFVLFVLVRLIYDSPHKSPGLFAASSAPIRPPATIWYCTKQTKAHRLHCRYCKALLSPTRPKPRLVVAFRPLFGYPARPISRVNWPRGHMISRFVHTRLKTTYFVIQCAITELVHAYLEPKMNSVSEFTLSLEEGSLLKSGWQCWGFCSKEGVYVRQFSSLEER